MDTSKFLQHVSLTKQFERRQAAWRPNMDVVEDAPLWRVDGVLMGEYTAPNAENMHEMVCFQPTEWQAVVHDNESDCTTP